MIVLVGDILKFTHVKYYAYVSTTHFLNIMSNISLADLNHRVSVVWI